MVPLLRGLLRPLRRTSSEQAPRNDATRTGSLEWHRNDHGRCSEQKISAVGFDLNPALVVVSRARLLGAGVWASINPLGDDVIAHATATELDNDALRFWFTERAANSIRGLQQSVHRLLVDRGTASQPAYKTSPEMSTLAAFFYTALFRTVRVLIAPRAGTNPTWWNELLKKIF